MRLWQRLATLVAFAIGLTAGAPAMAADAAKPEAKDIVLKGDARCTACHDEADAPKLLAIGKSRHGLQGNSKAPTCTNCHGESNKHADYKGKDKPPKPDVIFTKNSMVPARSLRPSVGSLRPSGNALSALPKRSDTVLIAHA